VQLVRQKGADGVSGWAWAGGLGRQYVIGRLFAMSLMAAALMVVAALGRPANPSAPAQATGVARGAGALRVALSAVLDAAGRAESDGDVATEGSVDDAWQALSGVYGRLHAQLDVAEGKRAPLLGVPPPAPNRLTRDDALLRSAMNYVRGAVETRDVGALQRARDLLDMRRG